MVAFLLKVITSRLAGPIASGVAVLLAVALGWQALQLSAARGELKRAKAQVADVQRNLDSCRANGRILRASIDTQNAAVERLRAEGESWLAASRKEAATARAAAEGLRRDAARILNAKPTADLCGSADALILEAIG